MVGTFYIGIDLGIRVCANAVLNQAAELIRMKRVPTSAKNLLEMVEPYGRRARVAFEECELSAWAYGVLKGHVREIVVADPKRNAWIARDAFKDDPEDAVKLARLLRAGLLHPIHQAPSEERAIFKRLVQHYEDATRRQATLKLQIGAQLRRDAIGRPATGLWDEARRSEALSQLPNEGTRAIVEDLLQTYDALKKAQKRSADAMKKFGTRFPEVARLDTVPGVGPINACRFVGYVQTPHRFGNRRQLWRYSRLGIVDRRSDGRPLGRRRLDRSGVGTLKDISRKAFEAAMRTRDDNGIRGFYQASRERTGNATHARLSTQRKILSLMMAIWRQGGTYQEERLTPVSTRR